MSSRIFRKNLTAMDPSILQDSIMSIQLLSNYMGICANMPDLRAVLNPNALIGPIRHYALQHFIYVASRLSKAQVVDLLQDDQLQWGEQSVHSAVCEWESENNDTLEYTHQDRQVYYLNICWTNGFDVCGAKNEVPGILPSRESYVVLLGNAMQMCTWGGHLVLVFLEQPFDIFIHNLLSSSMVMQMTQPLGCIICHKTITCMLVHGNLVYAGTREAHVLVFNLRTGALQSNWHHCPDSVMMMLSISREGDLLWVGHKWGNVTVRELLNDRNHLGVGWQSCDQLALQAWKNCVAFSVCEDTMQIRIWDASSGTV